MAITSFSDISGLEYYINAGDAPVAPSPAAIESITSIAATEQVFTQRNGNNGLTREDNAVGAMPGFNSSGGDNPFHLLNAPSRGDGLCFVTVVDTGSAPEGMLFDVGSTGAGAGYLKVEIASNAQVKFVISGSTNSTGLFLTPNTTAVLVTQWKRPVDGAAPEGVWEVWLYTDANPAEYVSGTRMWATNSMEDIGGIFDDYYGNKPWQGRTGMWMFYHKPELLTAAEVADIAALAQYWVANGEGPPVDVHPGSGFFDAGTNDTDAALTWVWSADSGADPDTWVGVDTVSGLSTSYEALGGQDNARLRIDSASSVAGAGWVRCRAETGYAVSYSDAAQLDIQAA